jgi:hypothetical protein
MKPLDSGMVHAQITDVEWQAMHKVWEQEGGSPSDFPETEAVRILVEIRARALKIESNAVQSLARAIGEGRQTPRRHQRLLLWLILAAAVIMALLYFITAR